MADSTRHDELPVVLPLDVELQAGADALHLLAAVPYPSGVLLALALGPGARRAPLWSLTPVAAALRTALDVETASGSGSIDLLRWEADVAGELVLEPAAAPGARALWIAPVPMSGGLRLRLRSGAAEGAWTELDTEALRAAAARAVDLWAPFREREDGPEAETFAMTRPHRGGPPVNVLGRTLAVQEVVAQDEAHALVVGPFRAYPNGFTVEVAALARTPDAPAVMGSDVAEALRLEAGDLVDLELRDASGREWTADDDGQVLDHATRAHVVRAVYWFRGRPVDGPLTVRARWWRAGLDGRVVVEGRELLRLAATCEDLL